MHAGSNDVKVIIAKKMGLLDEGMCLRIIKSQDEIIK
jgi:hypothetical protein